MIVGPHWGATPPLLEPPTQMQPNPYAVELRPTVPRHLIECYLVSGAPVVRCDQRDGLGFEHPAIRQVIGALRASAPLIESIFAGSIIEVLPTTAETAVGKRVAVAQLADIYRFNDVDLRSEPFANRRALLERVVSALDHPQIVATPLLRALPLREQHAATTLPATITTIVR